MTTSGDNNNMNHPAYNFENYIPSVAYTLGDKQPVRSTYIAHDPYFFMDVDDLSLEEELMRDLEYGFSPSSLTPSIYDEDNTFLETLISLDDNLVFQCGEEDLPETDLAGAKKILSNSRYAAALIEFAEVNHIHYIASPAVAFVEYNRAENIILYQPVLSELELVKGLIVALRQAWQNHRGALLQPVALYPDHAVFINRAQKADCMGALLRSAWELDLAGYHDLWSSLENGSSRDLTHAFGREAASDFRSLNNGDAAYAVFETWFLSDRSRNADTGLIQKMLADYQGHQFEDEDMSQLVVVDLVKALGEMPYGKNYLAQHIPTLLTDPIFTEVRERSAANFLWFIKFEKTFNEVEQSLQKHSSSPRAPFKGQGDNSFNISTMDLIDYDDKTAQTGILIPFPGNRRSVLTNVCGNNSGQGAEVIPFDITVRPFNGNFLP